jgi:hypothetical protein
LEGATSSKKIPDRLVADCLGGMNHSYSIGIFDNMFFLTEFTASAKKCHETAVPGENFYLVLRGAALSDLPDVESEIDLYRKVVCPVLILTVEGDDSHPVSTANALHSVLPTSILHVAVDKKSAMRDWPDVISSFLLSLP